MEPSEQLTKPAIADLFRELKAEVAESAYAAWLRCRRESNAWKDLWMANQRKDEIARHGARPSTD